MGTLLDSLAVKQPSRDHTEQCRTRTIQAVSSDADLRARIQEAHERMSRSVSDAEPSIKKVRFDEHPTVPVSPAVSTSHTVSAPVAHGGSSSSSAPSQITTAVEHVRPDDSDEHVGSKEAEVVGTRQFAKWRTDECRCEPVE